MIDSRTDITCSSFRHPNASTVLDLTLPALLVKPIRRGTPRRWFRKSPEFAVLPAFFDLEARISELNERAKAIFGMACSFLLRLLGSALDSLVSGPRLQSGHLPHENSPFSRPASRVSRVWRMSSGNSER